MKKVEVSSVANVKTKCVRGLVYLGCALGIAMAFSLASAINLLS